MLLQTQNTRSPMWHSKQTWFLDLTLANLKTDHLGNSARNHMPPNAWMYKNVGMSRNRYNFLYYHHCCTNTVIGEDVASFLFQYVQHGMRADAQEVLSTAILCCLFLSFYGLPTTSPGSITPAVWTSYHRFKICFASQRNAAATGLVFR